MLEAFRWTDLVLLSLAFVAVGAVAEAAQRPDPIAPEGCALYVGQAVGNNDPTQLFELRICDGEDGTWSGIMQTSSLVSGYSIRTVEGTIEGDQYVGHETAFEQYAPNDTWMFCLCDEYRLGPVGAEVIEGHYSSVECMDQGQLRLERVEGEGESENESEGMRIG